ncbi:MAG: hypothetical protein ACO3UU_11800 [Minisyncoccia bacterium]
MILTILLVVATAVGVFLFVKNNPLRAKKIDDAAKEVINEVEQKVEEIIKK